ncbi:MAG TPA: AAA family ATPase, partial [Thermomicrobiales bacterium]|nr:AAA family ATPase [Thermomicrobiales bacterium]
MDDLGRLAPPSDRAAWTTHSPPGRRAGRAALVGRATEMAVLRAEVTAAFADGPRSVQLQGAPGIGKSRLLDEAIAVAREIDPETAILRGNCLDERGVPPYLPWASALRAPPGRSRSDAALRALGRRLAGDADGLPLTPGTLPTEQERFRLYEEVTQALARFAMAQPVVLAFDDLQWSDMASNALLRYVMIHLPPSPLLALIAARDDELSPQHPLLRTIDELGRRRLLRTIPVRPLERAATAGLIADVLPAAPDPALVDAVHDHCGGKPFCVEEVIAALVDGEERSGDAAAAVAWPA